MRRLIVLLVLAIMLLSATPAQAWWRHHHWGWRHHGWHHHHWGWRHHGWGGYACAPSYGYGGWGGFGGYARAYFPHRHRAMWGYGGYYGYAPASVGYYAAQPAVTTYSAARVATLPQAFPVYSKVSTSPQPQPLRNLLGLNDRGPLQINAPAIANLLARIEGRLSAAPDMSNVRIANPDSRRTAEKHIADGDALFRVQNFNSALQRYKLAAAMAPDLAEAHWRQGHALVATHNYPLATSAFKRAIALTDDLSRGGFNLERLYGGTALTKTAHLESLSEWALSRSESSDPFFLLGVFLNYDLQQERAEKFFSYASDLAGISGGHIAVFEPPLEEPAAEVASVPVRVSVPVKVGTEI